MQTKLLRAIHPGQIIKFGLVGLLATGVYYLLLWALVELVSVPVLIATSIAFVVVTIENYILHYRWTFRSSSEHSNAFPRFVLMNIVGFMINFAIMYWGVQLLLANYLLVQAVAIFCIVVWNYTLSRFWIFND